MPVQSSALSPGMAHHAGATELALVALWLVTSSFGALLCRGPGRVPGAACLPGCGGRRDPSGWFLPHPRGHPTGVATGGAGAARPLPGGASHGYRVGPPSDHVPAQYTLLSPHAWVPSWELQYPPNWVPVTGIFWGSGSYFGPFPGPTDEAVPGGTGCFLGNH